MCMEFFILCPLHAEQRHETTKQREKKTPQPSDDLFSSDFIQIKCWLSSYCFSCGFKNFLLQHFSIFTYLTHNWSSDLLGIFLIRFSFTKKNGAHRSDSPCYSAYERFIGAESVWSVNFICDRNRDWNQARLNLQKFLFECNAWFPYGYLSLVCNLFQNNDSQFRMICGTFNLLRVIRFQS